MTYKDLMQILKEIRNECANRKYCDGCKYDTIYGCALKHIPEDWTLELLYSYPKNPTHYPQIKKGTNHNVKTNKGNITA